MNDAARSRNSCGVADILVTISHSAWVLYHPGGFRKRRVRAGLNGPRDRPILRRHVWPEINKHIIDVAVAPPLRRIVAFDDGMARRVKMSGGMFAGRLITASHMTAGPADPQIEPMGYRSSGTPRSHARSAVTVLMVFRCEQTSLMMASLLIAMTLMARHRCLLAGSRRREPPGSSHAARNERCTSAHLTPELDFALTPVQVRARYRQT